MLLALVVGLIASWDHWGIVASGVLVWFWFGGAALLQQPGTLAGRPTRRARADKCSPPWPWVSA